MAAGARATVYLLYAEAVLALQGLRDAGPSADWAAALNDMLQRLRALSLAFARVQNNPTTALEPDVAAEIGTWLRLRRSALLDQVPDLGPDERADLLVEALGLPGRDESLRNSITKFTLDFVETY